MPKINYSESFGLQWNLFKETQLDSKSGINSSADRFWSATKWTKAELKDKLILDVGCGAGRFAEVALEAGAIVVAIDYSTSVDACYENLKHHENLYIIQANIYELPFKDNSFDYIYSLGVLQHTPDVKGAFFSLPRLLKKDGKICVDYYRKSWRILMHPKYWLRPITKYLPNSFMLTLLKFIVPIIFPVSWLIGKLPYGQVVKKIIPVADPIYFYEKKFGKIPMKYKERQQWALLDTFDWLTPTYDNPQTETTVYSWMKEAQLRDIEVHNSGHLVACGRR